MDNNQNKNNNETVSKTTNENVPAFLMKATMNKTPLCILPDLYLGNAAQASDEDFLVKNLGITHILSCIEAGAMQNKYDIIQRKLIDVDDSTTSNVRKHFDEAFEFIDNGRKDGNKILIHCASGCSRSPTVTIAYLMYRFGWPLDKALKHVQENRKQAHPNRAFMRQLQDYEKELSAKTSQ